jgi:hypothetical protein
MPIRFIDKEEKKMKTLEDAQKVLKELDTHIMAVSGRYHGQLAPPAARAIRAIIHKALTNC